MKKILHYRVVISDKTGLICDENEFIVENLNIIGENEINIVVDDLSFTTIKKEKHKYFTCVGKKEICLSANDSIWGNRITYSLYTFATKKASTIKKEIKEAVLAKFGFFITSLNLDCIKEPAR